MKTLRKITLGLCILTLTSVNAFSQCEWPCTLSAGTNKTSLCPGNAVNIGATNCLSLCTAPGCTYTLAWTPSGGTTCTATVYPTVTTTYTLTATLSGSCCAAGATGSCNVPPGSTCSGLVKTSTMTVTVNSSGCRMISPLIGVEENPEFLIISPNPNSGVFKTTISETGWSFINLEKSVPLIAVYDNTGKLILNKEITTNESEIDITSLAKGIYFVRIIDGENILAVKKVIYN